jgi:hypothetical protein
MEAVSGSTFTVDWTPVPRERVTRWSADGAALGRWGTEVADLVAG